MHQGAPPAHERLTLTILSTQVEYRRFSGKASTHSLFAGCFGLELYCLGSLYARRWAGGKGEQGTVFHLGMSFLENLGTGAWGRRQIQVQGC
jgi:hypothetical protein